jgi:hypothetical protein
MRARYALTATRGNGRQTVAIEGDSEVVPAGLGTTAERLRFDATCTAIKTVLDLALDDPLWGLGAIELRDDRGEVIHAMEPKP